MLDAQKGHRTLHPMEEGSAASPPKISEIAPREIAGRDTIARFQAQFRAAAYECLAILGGKSVDRVYCDYQDDFVSRTIEGGKPVYHFYQVKTKSKANHLWSKLEVFGLKAKGKVDLERIASSFAGKLLLHTTRFTSSCGNVVLLTNVQLDDDVAEIAEAIGKGDFSGASLKALVSHFNAAFKVEAELPTPEVEANIRRLVLRPGVRYLDPHGHEFEALARDAIYQYSEIDLHHAECEEIINSLVALVEKKSFSKLISDVTETDLDDLVGIGIGDLLEILSISKGAYERLLAGGDTNAIKSASIIQRKLTEAGAPREIVDYCSQCKVDWDIWFRDKRHTVPEFDLNMLLDEFHGIKNRWIRGESSFATLGNQIDSLWSTITVKGFARTLSKELLLGGVLSAVVRSES